MKKFMPYILYYVRYVTPLAMGLFVWGCTTPNKWLGLKNDHPLEQISEDVIQSYTGVRTDLSPENSEF